MHFVRTVPQPLVHDSQTHFKIVMMWEGPMEKLKALFAHLRNIKDPNLRTAWMIAIAADVTQWVLFPLFASGGSLLPMI